MFAQVMEGGAAKKEEVHKAKLVGYANFKRHNPKSDRFPTHTFHHVEFWCGDATNTARRYSWAMGAKLCEKSDQTTGNVFNASYVINSQDITFVFTAPYAIDTPEQKESKPVQPGYNVAAAHKFNEVHGVGVRAVGVRVDDAADAYAKCVANGGIGVLEPTKLTDKSGQEVTISEVQLYPKGDVVLRWISWEDGKFDGKFIPGYTKLDGPDFHYGLERIDHIVSNTPNLLEHVDYIMTMTGWHEFAEFISDDVGTVDSGLNSMVIGNNSEMILMPINEPTFGTPRKSQIQSYLEQNQGTGVQHIAIKTKDIFTTMKEMSQRSFVGGFEFIPAPNPAYYKEMRGRIGDSLTEEQYKLVEEYGLLVDKDDQGTLIQVFTRPLNDRNTLFLEIIQRVGCESEQDGCMVQAAGCGGFGKGNFGALFKSIEDYEKMIEDQMKAANAAQ